MWIDLKDSLMILPILLEWLSSGLIPVLVEAAQNTTVFGLDLSIESLRSRKFSVGIFIFLIVSLIIFAVIIWIYWPKRGKEEGLKRGEKIMFGAIIMGLFIAVAFGWLQLIEGYLV